MAVKTSDRITEPEDGSYCPERPDLPQIKSEANEEI
jgi:hypothetical protein